ncbi:hypothetical protein CRUP_037279, partial [Coryphaenoides rupestris]
FSTADTTVYWDQSLKTVRLKEGVLDPVGGGAYGFFNDTLLSSGWGVLEVRAGHGENPEPDKITFFLAGYLEGYLTARQIMDHYTNMYPQLIRSPEVLHKVQEFMTQQDAWSRQQVKLNQSSDPLWRHAGLPLSLFAVQFLNAVGDLLDLIPALGLGPRPPHGDRDLGWPDMGHCSALIKMLPGFENLFFAHSSWYTYAATMRIYKHWDFHIQDGS